MICLGYVREALEARFDEIFSIGITCTLEKLYAVWQLAYGNSAHTSISEQCNADYQHEYFHNSASLLSFRNKVRSLTPSRSASSLRPKSE